MQAAGFLPPERREARTGLHSTGCELLNMCWILRAGANHEHALDIVALRVPAGTRRAASEGVRRAFCVDVDRALHQPGTSPLITEADLERLPSAIRRYLRTVGAIGYPRVQNMHARMHGRIRSGPAAPWMTFGAEQYSFFKEPARYFYMKASRWLVPIHVYHRYAGTAASMQVKVFDQVPVAFASGPEMTKAETVTMFNDMCLLAPATLIDAGIQWEPVDETRTFATFANAGHTIRAELSFNDLGELVNFSSNDRSRTEADGSMRAMPWSTPMQDYRAFGHVRLGSRGSGIWHESGGPFAYVEIEIDEVAYNIDHR